MRILIHTCCAPCMIYPLEQLRKKDYEVHGYFYNPNIHPLAEYEKRRGYVERLSQDSQLPLVSSGHNQGDFLEAISGLEEKLQRCPICWYLRLKKTAKMAKQLDCQVFTTTLLVSPYQDQEALKKIGADIAREEGLVFYYEDFRTGFKQAHDKARKMGIYCQKYCGCSYSEAEKCKKSGKR